MELINREELINKINAYMVTTPDVTMVRKLINELPIIESRPQGEWIEVETPKGYVRKYQCSNCGYDDGYLDMRYCPNCGADMREGEQ